ncbi:two-component system chemotaxis sensor kinase CheA [Granulicella aggregans]|uniref:histidine kinase n=1 Tax=Granulicella aggregans TaxID=474949 RepID=A0A7W7ZBV2_9BACT|nr:chemotaxis protein CheW [Granulicella aggregans]MBB5056759.1 two-component system chemotaxis sensor kinase CheA [Granulicella aggregans]
MDVNEQEERDEDIRQFLIESNENLATLDDEIVKLEKTPENNALISSVFRTIHTIKGTCGFFGFDLLSATAHITENILAQARAGQRTLTPDVISLILEAVDKIKILLVNIEQTGVEGDVDCAELIGRLEIAHDSCGAEAAHAAPAPPAPVAAVPSPVVEVPVATAPLPPAAPTPAPVPVAAPPAPVPVAVAPPPPVQAAPPPLAPVAAAPIPAPPPPPATPAAPAKAPAASTDSTIRVDVGLLDKLMNLVGELVLARNQLLQNSSTQSMSLQKTTQRLNLITSELQEGVMKTRMQPIGVVWNKLPRVVRDLASQVGKQISIEMIGADTELDKTIIEAIKDPLTHIVRNSCDHGVENPATRTGKGKDPEGRLLLRAFHEGGVVNIEITDDGAGIDPNKMRTKAIEKGLITEEQAAQMNDQSARELIFAPGFSTAEKVTSISGRGVGMDVVKTNIEKIGGNVEILEGKPYGTTIRIRIPLTLAIIPGLIVSLTPKVVASSNGSHVAPTRDERFVVPQANLLELVRLEGVKIEERIKSLHGTPIFHYRGQLLPLVYLRRILGKSMPEGEPEAVSIVVLQAENRSLGLVVDAIHDTQEIVVKPLGRQLKGLDCYLGGTIMGDGLPALILDVAGLARLANLQGRNSSATVDSSRSGPQQAALPTKMLLLFRAGNFHRIAVPLPLVARLEKIPTNTVERAAGQSVLHYRGDILPLVDLASVLEPGSGHDAFAEEIIQLIVFTDGARRIGVIVDQIVDIVDEAVTVRRGAAAPGLLGSAVIGGKITDLLDLHAVVSAGGGNWLNSDDIGSQGHTILLLDSCLPAREMIAEYLGASGFDVTSANSVGDAMPRIRQSSFDIVIAAVPEGRSGFDTLKALRRDKQFDRTPILGLVDHPEQLDAYVPDGLSYDARIMRSNREDLLASISSLVRPSGHYHQAMYEEAA